MSEKEEVEVVQAKEFLVMATAHHALDDVVSVDVVDTVPAANEEDALDYVTGRLAEKDYIITKVHIVAEREVLVRTATALNP